MEHVRSERPCKAWVQERPDGSGTPPRVRGGVTARATPFEAITTAGFRVARVRRYALSPDWIPTNPHVLGSARADACTDHAARPRPQPLDAELLGCHPGSVHPRTDLRERGLAGSGGVVAKRSKAAVVGRAQLVGRYVLGGLE